MIRRDVYKALAQTMTELTSFANKDSITPPHNRTNSMHDELNAVEPPAFYKVLVETGPLSARSLRLYARIRSHENQQIGVSLFKLICSGRSRSSSFLNLYHDRRAPDSARRSLEYRPSLAEDVEGCSATCLGSLNIGRSLWELFCQPCSSRTFDTRTLQCQQDELRDISMAFNGQGRSDVERDVAGQRTALLKSNEFDGILHRTSLRVRHSLFCNRVSFEDLAGICTASQSKRRGLRAVIKDDPNDCHLFQSWCWQAARIQSALASSETIHNVRSSTSSASRPDLPWLEIAEATDFLGHNSVKYAAGELNCKR
nr:hypothetical protein CFP56_03835 [Quercus suber]